MKFTTLFFLLIVFLPSGSYAQDAPSAVDLSNGLRDAIYRNDHERAFTTAVALAETKGAYLADIVHSTVTNILLKASDNQEDVSETSGYILLSGLNNLSNSKISALIADEFAYAQILNETNGRKKRKMVEDYLSNLGDSVNYKPRTQRYSILISRELDPDHPKELELINQLLDKTIQTFLDYQYLTTMPAKAYDAMVASWSRFVLASACFDKSQVNPDVQGEFLKLAAKYSTAPVDAAYQSYNSADFSILAGSYSKSGYRDEYLAYLGQHPNKQEFLEVQTDLCLLNPTDQAMAELKEIYAGAKGSSDGFTSFWHQKVLDASTPLPVKEFRDAVDSLPHQIGNQEKWTFLDVWGSWCSPCLKEFPKIQKAYEENLKDPSSHLIITTWVFDNPEPMKKLYAEKGFTVPYTHISNDFQLLFHIHSWPTKMLISPEGTYIKIPYGVDWLEYVKNYSGVN